MSTTITPREFERKEIRDLTDTIAVLRDKHSELNDIIGKISSERDGLQKQLDGLKKAIPLIQYKHPSFILADLLGLTSNQVVKIAEYLNLLTDEWAARRIPRVKKDTPQKYETIVLFSVYGFALIFRAISEALHDPEKHTDVFKIIKRNHKAVLQHFLSFDEPSAEEMALSSESVLKNVWDTPEEDKAWAHLQKVT